jgi:glycosyltransferase involved in cell wall biosynthesis
MNVDAHPARTRVSEGDVLRLIVQRRLNALPKGPLEIQSHDLQIALGRDVVDFWLGLHRRDWIWTDLQARSAPAAPLHRAFARLAYEGGWATPAGYLRHRRRVARLESAVPPSWPTAAQERALFLRTDHVFGVVAGGSVGHLAGVIRGFRRDGVAVQVVSTDYLVDVPRDQGFHLARPEYGVARNFSELVRLNYNEQLHDDIERHWSQWRPDFVYHRYSLFNYVGPALRARYGVPYVCEYNGPLTWVQRNWDDRPLQLEGLAERIERLNMSASDLVVVVSRPLVQEAVSRGARPERVLVNPNGVDPDRYAPHVSGAEVRRRYGLDDALVVGFIGTIGPWHGVEKLVEAAALLQEDARDQVLGRLRFLVIGDGVRMGEVRNRIREAGLGDRVILTGLVPQEQGPAHLAACDILASPHVPNPDGSEFFGSPTKLFEYMAMGRAIVASELAQIGEVLEHGVTAYLVPPADPAALAAGIRALALDAALRGRLANNARAIAVREHTWDAHSRRILEALAAQRDRTPAVA